MTGDAVASLLFTSLVRWLAPGRHGFADGIDDVLQRLAECSRSGFAARNGSSSQSGLAVGVVCSASSN